MLHSDSYLIRAEVGGPRNSPQPNIGGPLGGPPRGFFCNFLLPSTFGLLWKCPRGLPLSAFHVRHHSQPPQLPACMQQQKKRKRCLKKTFWVFRNGKNQINAFKMLNVKPRNRISTKKCNLKYSDFARSLSRAPFWSSSSGCSGVRTLRLRLQCTCRSELQATYMRQAKYFFNCQLCQIF